ncbi:MAG: hypothetical protein AAF662_02790 [Pseudomonadota bacterium]
MQQLSKQQAAEIYRSFECACRHIRNRWYAAHGVLFVGVIYLVSKAPQDERLGYTIILVGIAITVAVLGDFLFVGRLALSRMSFNKRDIAQFANVHVAWKESTKWCGLMDRISRSILDANQGRTVSVDTAVDVIERVGGYAARTVDREKVNSELERIARA